MTTRQTPHGWELHLRSRGAGRVVAAGFLSAWLCFWAAGELLVLFLLLSGAMALWTGRPPIGSSEPIPVGPALAAGGFLVIGFAFWTLGGVMAIRELLSSLWAIAPHAHRRTRTGAMSSAAAGGRSTGQRHTIAYALRDPTEPRRLGLWLARRAGIPFEDKVSDPPSSKRAVHEWD